MDGYNVLLTVEAALSGGLLLLGRDGALRDLAAMSRHYRRVHVTRQAVELIYSHLDRIGCARVLWCLDQSGLQQRSAQEPDRGGRRSCRIVLARGAHISNGQTPRGVATHRGHSR